MIKQHLKIKSFWGQSENAVKTQSMDCTVSILCTGCHRKKDNHAQAIPLYEIPTGLEPFPIFEKKMPINQLFQQTQKQYFKELKHNQ
jgi:hypothetical protein